MCVFFSMWFFAKTFHAWYQGYETTPVVIDTLTIVVVHISWILLACFQYYYHGSTNAKDDLELV